MILKHDWILWCAMFDDHLKWCFACGTTHASMILNPRTKFIPCMVLGALLNCWSHVNFIYEEWMGVFVWDPLSNKVRSPVLCVDKSKLLLFINSLKAFRESFKIMNKSLWRTIPFPTNQENSWNTQTGVETKQKDPWWIKGNAYFNWM